MSLPIVGQSLDQMRRHMKAEVAANVKQLMRDIISDQLFHAEVVAAGEFHFRGAFGKQFGAFYDGNRSGCDDLANVVFRFAREVWGRKYPDIAPGAFLDNVRITAPPTEAEIEDAWEIEIGSSESAMRSMYEGSARVRKGKDLGAKTTRPERTH